MAFIVRRRAMKGGKHRAKPMLVRADRAGTDDMAARFPAFRELQSGIKILGLGALGAPSATESPWWHRRGYMLDYGTEAALTHGGYSALQPRGCGRSRSSSTRFPATIRGARAARGRHTPGCVT